MGTWKAMSSIARVTTVLRERRIAAKPAALSIHAISVPPNRLPCGLVSVGNTDSSRRASITDLRVVRPKGGRLPARALRRGEVEAGGVLRVDPRRERPGDAQQRLLVLGRYVLHPRG